LFLFNKFKSYKDIFKIYIYIYIHVSAKINVVFSELFKLIKIC
jgi:hypothetical protein